MAAEGLPRRRRVGIVGFGKIGQYLATAITSDEATRKKFELVWVWNRTPRKLEHPLLSPGQRLTDLADSSRLSEADLIVEVAHPAVIQEHAARFLEHADLMIGSPTSLAAREVEAAIRTAASAPTGRGAYVPSGALWGAAVRHLRA
jgi:aspartate dehydrogenase